MESEATKAANPANCEIRNHGNGEKSTNREVADVNLDWSEMTNQALKRVQEFVQTSLREAPPQVAAMDASSALFYKALFQLNRAVDQALQQAHDPIDRIDGLARAIDLMLRIARQIDRFGQLRLLLLEARQTLSAKTAT
jgi:hypothetical protein